jgi:hypothetical protein
MSLTIENLQNGVVLENKELITHAILNSMRAHASARELQALGCSLLKSSLVYSTDDDDLRRTLRDMGAMDVLVEAMSLFLQITPVDHEGVLQDKFILAYDVIKEIQDCKVKTAKPLSKRAAEVILRVMAKHQNFAVLVASAMAAISSLTYTNAQNADALGKPGVKLIVDVCQKHESHENIQNASLNALMNMISSNEKLKIYARELGAIQAVIQGMRRHARCLQVQIAGCKFHHNMFLDTVDSQSRHVFTYNHGIGVVIEAMKTFRTDVSLQFSASECFLHFQKENDVSRVTILLRECVPEHLMCAMRNHQHSSSIQTSASMTLMHIQDGLTGSQRHGLVTLRQQVLTLVLDNMPIHVANADVMKAFLYAVGTCTLGHSCEWPFYQKELERRDSLRVLAECVRLHSDNARLVRNVCHIVWNGVHLHVRNQDNARESGLINAILKAVDKHKDDDMLFSVRLAFYECTVGNQRNAEYLKNMMTMRQAKRLGRSKECLLDSLELSQRTCQLFGLPAAQLQNSKRSLIDEVKHSDVVAGVVCELEKQKLAEACSVCGKTAGELGIRMLKCSACTIAPKYCSAKCQKADWTTHKTECRLHKK